MRIISALELNEALHRGENYQIIDIRESYEYSACNIGSIHIPMGELCDRCSELSSSKNIVIMCRSGKRAEAMANLLTTDFEMNNIWILEGGILAWKEQVDQTLELD
jgi:rhodanese-related sulfurtransferase